METLSIQDIDFWNYNSDKGTKLLFDIYHNIIQEKTGDILICRDNRYYLCLKFQNDYLLTISTILSSLRNLNHYYERQNTATYSTNDNYDYHVYQHDDNSYILSINYHNNTLISHKERSERIRENNLKNIENIIKNNKSYGI